jgi:3-hydroxyisobutyrate dehydrogenase
MTQNEDNGSLPQIALLGLGSMGYSLAQRLAGTGHQLTVWNRTSQKASGLQKQGIVWAHTAAEAVRHADFILLMLTDDEAVIEIAGAIAGVLTDGATLIDLSTVHPETTTKIRDLIQASVSVVDAPVMGSADAARNGTLGLLVGATEQGFERVKPLLSTLGKPVRVGGPGAGAAAKVAVMSAIIPGILAVGEAFVVGRALGLDDDTLKTVFAHSPVAALTQRAFAEQANYATRLATKDLGLAHRTEQTPVVTLTMETLQATPRGDDDLGLVARHLPTAAPLS